MKGTARMTLAAAATLALGLAPPKGDPAEQDLAVFEDTVDLIRNEPVLKPHQQTSLLNAVEREKERNRAFAASVGARHISEVNPTGRPDTPHSAAYAATRQSNPLISQKCRDEADHWARQFAHRVTGKSRAELHDHEKKAELDFSRGTLNAAKFFNHIKECQLCGPKVARLVSCHIDAISSLEAEDTLLVLFDVGQAGINSATAVKLHEFATRVRREGKDVLLWGSASNLGGSRLFNEALSKRRAEAVLQVIRHAGVDDDRLFLQWNGWSPPRLSREPVALQLGWHIQWREISLRDARHMDQNVLLIAWATGR